jgi:aspartate-semialdehyde dehydrogenase
MNIAIDGLSTLLGQAIADLIGERKLIQQPLISIMHGDAQDLNKDDNDQLDSSPSLATENHFLQDINFSDLDLIFIADTQDHNRLTLNQALEAGVRVIDCVGLCAEQRGVPLVVHDINSHEIRDLRLGFAIALPSPAATMLAQVLFPLTQFDTLERVSVCHFSPMSNLGKVGVEQLAGQTARLLNGMPMKKKHSGSQLAFNLLPQCGAIGDTDYSDQETQLMRETKRLLNDDTIVMNATCIQVPVFYAQAQVVEISFAAAVDSRQIEILLKQSGLQVQAVANASPAALTASGEKDGLIVSRVRQNIDDERSLTLWCMADNLRRGAAVNAVQVAEILIKSYL